MAAPQTGVILNAEAWTEGRMILTDDQLTVLKEQAEAFVKYLG